MPNYFIIFICFKRFLQFDYKYCLRDQLFTSQWLKTGNRSEFKDSVNIIKLIFRICNKNWITVMSIGNKQDNE